jgi:hypothetical protein
MKNVTRPEMPGNARYAGYLPDKSIEEARNPF